MFAFPIGNIITGDVKLVFKATGLYQVIQYKTEAQSYYYLLVALILLCAIVSLIAVFLFKNRKLQMKITQLSIILNAVVLVGVFYYSNAAEEAADAKMHYQVGILMPLIAIIFLILAYRSIKKDEDLVRAADRLR